MKPAKGLAQFATWLMRLALAFFVYVVFLHTLKIFDFKSIHFYLALAFILFGSLLFIGGFMSKPGITVFSGLMLFFASLYEIIILFSSGISAELATYGVIATAALYFVTSGNKH
ncbi:MAG: hypothetical protein ABR968_03240 [Bacteroidales bacterium]|jgi:hypothetical protein